MAPSFQGLDIATAPPAATAKRMLDTIDGRWWNVYIGGPYTGGHGWSPEVVKEYARHGIDRFMLTYVGQQAGPAFKKQGTLTAAKGREDAREALAIARSYGYTGDFPLCLDVEGSTYAAAPSDTVKYTKAWCATVREAGARPGVYSNPGPLQAMAKASVPADFVWIASWVSTTAGRRDPHEAKGMPKELWGRPGQRAWQYAGEIQNKPAVVLNHEVDINVADLGCLAPPPNGVIKKEKKRRALRLGDRGPIVKRATHRLSVLRSQKTGQPYLDGPRSRFDAETEAALKAFQSEHGMPASGRYGRESALALLKALKRAKGGEKKIDAPVVGATRLPALVREFRRLDAQADQAWQRLEAYGRRRVRILEREKKQAEDDKTLADVTESLARIEKVLAELVELERQEIALERDEAAPATEPAAVPTALGAHVAADPEYVAEMVAVAAPPATGGSNGAGGAAPPADATRRSITDLSDTELDTRIDLLDKRLDQSRKLRIARYARAEKALAELPGVVIDRKDRQPDEPKDKTKDKTKDKEKDKTKDRQPDVPERKGVKPLQRALNRFSEKYLEGLIPLEVDGKKGPETDKRIRTIKYYLGYGGDERRSAAVPLAFLRRLEHPRSPRASGPRMLARAAARRRKQRKAAKRLVGGPIEGTPKHIIDAIVLPIAAQCGINRSVGENDAANARHGLTVNGGRSDHQGPAHIAWAADISNSWQPTPEMDKLAAALAKRFDIPWSGSGLVNASNHGYRYQLIYRTHLGGNHFNHVHFGVRDV